jgi:hypothetical protein
MKKIYLFAFAALLSGSSVMAQTFSTGTVAGGDKNSGNCGGVMDVNKDGLDDIIILDQSTDLYVAFQQPDGSFVTSSYGTVSNTEQWGMCVGDVDNDGWADVLSGGYYDGVHVVNINSTNSSTQSDYAWADIFMQATNMVDINNDGWLDSWACHDDGHSAILQNDGTGNMINGAALIDGTFYPEVPGGNDNSGNYGTVWCDFDRDGDIDLLLAKCRQFINDPYDARRTNILLVNDGNNNYHDEAPERGLVNLQQSWTGDFGDIDNDGDFDCFITTHSGTLEIYENDGLGYFTNITEGSGLEVSGFFLQGKLADFDNDGYLDVIHAGGNHGYYHNNGNKTWTLVNNVFQNNDTMHSFSIGDLNNDGWIDLYATYGNSYVTPDNSHPNKLFLNNGGSNHYMVFDLTGTVSNKFAVGAVVEIHGAFGTQVRDVRAGESYGITNSNRLYFGLGSATSVDYAIVHWPAGGSTFIDNPSIDSFHEVTEEVCAVLPTATISTPGGLNICEGQSITLSVDNASGSYVWSNGATTSSITVNNSGNYYVTVYDANGCANSSNALNISVANDPTPTISAGGDLEFCEGYSVELVANPGQSYEWSNGQISQAISVTEAGTYSVTVTGNCQTLTSETIDVTVYDAPAAPSIADITLTEPGTADLSVTGNDVRWYDAVDATTPIATGNNFTTPVINSTTSYWVEDVTTYGGNTGVGGMINNGSDAGGNLTNSNYHLIFDVNTDIILNTVKVYANTTGNRVIRVYDSANNIVNEGTFAVSQGEQVVTLDFAIPAGTGYSLRSGDSNPNLWRDKDLTTGSPFGYPYDVAGLATITGTSVQGNDSDNYYYFFYDWHVSTPSFECAGPREEVVVILVGIDELESVSNVSIYPNPSTDVMNVSFNSLQAGKLNVRIIDAVGRVVSSTTHSNGTGSQTFSMNVENLAAGIYQVEFEMEGKKATRKVIIE